MTTSVDGDDYTWDCAPAGAVFNQSLAPAEARALGLVTVDLRTPDQREREDVAALNMRVDNLVDALEYLTQRVAELERAAVTVKG